MEEDRLMPNLIIPIRHTYDSVSRRVAMSVIDKVRDISGMDKSAPIEIRGDAQKAIQPGGEWGDKNPKVRFEHEGRVVVSFRESYVESEIINTEVRHPYAQPIFDDRDTGVHIKPIYSNTMTELNFTYRCKSKQEALRWRDDMKVRMGDNRQSHLHEVDYHYPVPDFCSLLLTHVHSLREAVAGYGDSLGEYLKRYYTDRATVLGTQGGDQNNTLLVIKEKQLGIQGWFDFDLPPEEEKNDDGPSYTIQFNYQFSYMKPLELNVVYPQIIHNQLISPDYLTVTPKQSDPLQLPTYKSEYHYALERFDFSARVPQRRLGGVAIPEWDEWIPFSVRSYTSSFINWMVVFEPRDLHTALSERDILDTGFLPDVLEYMRLQGDNMTHLGRSPIHFGLFRENEPVSDGELVIEVTDNAFTVKTKTPVDLRLKYHIRMSFCTFLPKYTEESLMSLHEHGCVALLLFQTLCNNLDIEHASREYLTDDCKLDIGFIKRFFGFLQNQQTDHYPGKGKINNNRYDDESWYLDNTGFGNRLDVPYVMVLTILAQNRNRVEEESNGGT